MGLVDNKYTKLGKICEKVLLIFWVGPYKIPTVLSQNDKIIELEKHLKIFSKEIHSIDRKSKLKFSTEFFLYQSFNIKTIISPQYVFPLKLKFSV